MKNRFKFAIVGAGSISFCPATLSDILLSRPFAEVELEIALMDIAEEALRVSEVFCREAAASIGRKLVLTATTDLEAALDGADFVVTAIEKDRYKWWSMDFHIPRRYGFRQVYGENGGPGGMFHTLRNLGPMLEIARTMERVCPDAWLLNYTNPEAKLVEAISKLTRIKVVGLCHGEQMGMDQLAEFLQLPKDEIEAEAVGLNHFGWFTKVVRKADGADLYPLLREKERSIDWLAHWDEFGLSRLMFRTFGLWPYPGTNHIGEYLAWSDEMLASTKIQYFFDPAEHDPWQDGKLPEFVYSFSSNPTSRPLFPEQKPFAGDPGFHRSFSFTERGLSGSNEYGIPIAEAIAFDRPVRIGAVNMANRGYVPGLPEGMAVELPAMVDGAGIHPVRTAALPTAVTAMIAQQGAIHSLLIEAYAEQSKNKLLQAMLIDPTVSNYHNAVALIDEMCLRQQDILPALHW